MLSYSTFKNHLVIKLCDTRSYTLFLVRLFIAIALTENIIPGEMCCPDRCEESVRKGFGQV